MLHAICIAAIAYLGIVLGWAVLESIADAFGDWLSNTLGSTRHYRQWQPKDLELRAAMERVRVEQSTN